MKFRKIAAVITSAAMLASMAACGTGGSSAKNADGKTVITMWHITTDSKRKEYWEGLAKSYEEAHPDVSIELQAIQSEDFDGKLQTALQDPESAPDIFIERGGGKLQDQIAAGQVMDLTDKLDSSVKTSMKSALGGFTVDSKIYGVPYAISPGGIWYSKDLFAQAGIDTLPTTMEELNQTAQKLKDAGITPVALGAKDAWPAAHWWYWFALRECPASVFAETMTSKKFDDPCYLKASNDLKAFADTNPFQEGFLTTSVAQGAASSAGLIANHKAAMELMGSWEVSSVKSLTADGQPLQDLGFFPFPSVSGGKGDTSAMMGGMDGFAVAQWAPSQAVDFLNYIASTDNQKTYYSYFNGIPANADAQGVIDSSTMKDVLSAYKNASSMSLWLDSQFGQNVGNALNTGVVNMLAGKGSPEDIIAGTNQAAAKE